MGTSLFSLFTLFCIFHIFKSINFVTGTSTFLFVKVTSLSPGLPRLECLLSALGPKPNPESVSEGRPSRRALGSTRRGTDNPHRHPLRPSRHHWRSTARRTATGSPCACPHCSRRGSKGQSLRFRTGTSQERLPRGLARGEPLLGSGSRAFPGPGLDHELSPC